MLSSLKRDFNFSLTGSVPSAFWPLNISSPSRKTSFHLSLTGWSLSPFLTKQAEFENYVVAMDTDLEFTNVLTKHRLLIVQHLRLDRTFLFDYLISKSCFDKTDFELVQAEKTSESRASRFLDILSMKGESAFNHFIDALQILNPNLYEMLTGESATKSKRLCIFPPVPSFMRVNLCKHCASFLTSK